MPDMTEFFDFTNKPWATAVPTGPEHEWKVRLHQAIAA
jgi:hypothetical protein